MFHETQKHTHKGTQVAPHCRILHSLRSALERRLCKGEEDEKNVPHTGRTSSRTSALLVLRNPIVRYKSLGYQALLAVLHRHLLLALSLQSP